MIEVDDRVLMEQTLRAAITDAGEGADVDAVLTKLGWLEMLADEPDDAIAVVFGALGATNATATALDDVVLSALGQRPRAELAVLLPRFSTWDPPGRIDASELRAEGLATARAATAEEILVVCGTASQPWVGNARMTAAEARAVRGIDPAGGLHAVLVEGSASDATRLDPAAWRSAVALGQRTVAHQLLGASRAMLDLARSHALERMQFGRPIARFQAVRHRLADALVAVEALEAALTAAREEANPDTAALAKACAGRTAHTVARHCQQVLAGIGFTMEHPFHRFSKRALALEGLFGSADEIVRDVGRRLLGERRVPTLVEL
jgi:Acyl-CoA dehydrogenase, C-terminal domain